MMHEGLSARLSALPEPTMVALSVEMQAVVEELRKAALIDDLCVMITGETGTGKQEAAEFLSITSNHAHSRPDAPFVDVNCSGINENLVESELYGHVRGSFTGAYGDKVGLLEKASGGTLFLDEVGDASSGVQTRLLKFLDTGQIMRVGGVDSIEVRTRVVAATHRDLSKMAAEGKFREDLLFRLNVYSVHIPPLRERYTDMEPLIQSCITRFNDQHATSISTEVTSSVLSMLQEHSWPGNVRELFNAVERAIVHRGGRGRLETSDFAFRRIPKSQLKTTEDIQIGDDVSLETVEKLHLRRLYERHNGNKAKLGQVLGLHRPTVYNKLRKHGIIHAAEKDTEED
jgi:transcriptional regulator with PAS, ATPase and Fis domain